MKLKTDRLLLREFVKTDFPAVHDYASTDEATRFMPWGPNSVDETHAFLDTVIAKSFDYPRWFYDFAVLEKATNELIGGCNLHQLENEKGKAVLGYCFNPKSWGRGYATEAASRLLDFGFSDLELHRISATVDPNNAASVKVLQKIGMRKEGHLKEDILIRNHWRDSYLYAILDWEYMERKFN